MPNTGLNMKNPYWLFTNFCRGIHQDPESFWLDSFYYELCDENFVLECNETRETFQDRVEEKRHYARPRRQVPGRAIDRQRARWQPRPYEAKEDRPLRSYERSMKRCLRAKVTHLRSLIDQVYSTGTDAPKRHIIIRAVPDGPKTEAPMPLTAPQASRPETIESRDWDLRERYAEAFDSDPRMKRIRGLYAA